MWNFVIQNVILIDFNVINSSYIDRILQISGSARPCTILFESSSARVKAATHAYNYKNNELYSLSLCFNSLFNPIQICYIHWIICCGYLITLENSKTVLIKLTLDQGIEPVTSWQEIAIESMQDPGRQMKRHTGKSMEGHRVSRAFWFGITGETLSLYLWPKRKVSWLFFNFFDLADFHPNICLLSLYW